MKDYSKLSLYQASAETILHEFVENVKQLDTDLVCRRLRALKFDVNAADELMYRFNALANQKTSVD
jgi:hypothetical protein